MLVYVKMTVRFSPKSREWEKIWKIFNNYELFLLKMIRTRIDSTKGLQKLKILWSDQSENQFQLIHLRLRLSSGNSNINEELDERFRKREEGNRDIVEVVKKYYKSFVIEEDDFWLSFDIAAFKEYVSRERPHLRGVLRENLLNNRSKLLNQIASKEEVDDELLLLLGREQALYREISIRISIAYQCESAYLILQKRKDLALSEALSELITLSIERGDIPEEGGKEVERLSKELEKNDWADIEKAAKEEVRLILLGEDELLMTPSGRKIPVERDMIIKYSLSIGKGLEGGVEGGLRVTVPVKRNQIITYRGEEGGLEELIGDRVNVEELLASEFPAPVDSLWEEGEMEADLFTGLLRTTRIFVGNRCHEVVNRFRPFKSNTMLITLHQLELVVACRDIEVGEILYGSYGDAYWKRIWDENHLPSPSPLSQPERVEISDKRAKLIERLRMEYDSLSMSTNAKSISLLLRIQTLEDY